MSFQVGKCYAHKDGLRVRRIIARAYTATWGEVLLAETVNEFAAIIPVSVAPTASVGWAEITADEYLENYYDTNPELVGEIRRAENAAACAGPIAKPNG